MGWRCASWAQSGILGFQLFQSLCLVALHAAVFLVPAIVGLVSHIQLFTGLRYRFTLSYQHIGLAELVHDLFGVVSFLWHGSDLLNWLFTTLDLDQQSRARSVSHPI